MALLGIDVGQAAALSQGLRGWRLQIDDIASVLMQAEGHSDVPSHAGGLLDQIGSDGALLASQIAAAVQELTSFRISEFAHVQDLSTAIAAARDIRIAHATGRSADASDYARLREIFGQAIDDPDTATAAYALAVAGYPVLDALMLRTQAEVAAVYTQLAESMEAGLAPAESGLPASLFPPAYREWHTITLELDFGHEPSGPRLVDRDTLRLDGLAGAKYIVKRGRLPEYQARAAVAAWIGPTASEWLGESLAAMFSSTSNAGVVHIGDIIGQDTTVSTAFFNELGPTEVALIPQLFMGRGQELFDDELAAYSLALAAATNAGGLAFSGADLVQADVANTVTDIAAGVQVELLLLADGYEQNFLLGAAAASFRLRSGDHATWSGLWPAGSGRYPDPRTVAAQAVASAGRSHELIRLLDEHDELDLLVDPPVPFNPDNPHAFAHAQLSPLSILLAEAGDDPAASTALIAYLYDRGGYAALPLGADIPHVFRDEVREMRTIEDVRIIEGLSAMLARAALHSYAIDAPLATVQTTAQTTLQTRVAAQLERPYFAAYDTLVNSGSGHALYLVYPLLLATVVQAELSTGSPSLRLDQLTDFLGAAHAVGHKAELDGALAEDENAAGLSQALSLIGLGTGLLSGGATTTVSTVASAASLVTGSDNTALDTARRHLQQVLEHGITLRVAGMAAIFGSGLVRTPDGRVVKMRRKGHDLFRLVDEHGKPLRFTESMDWHSFTELSSNFMAASLLNELTVNGEPVSNLLATIEAADTNMETAQIAANKVLAE